MPNIANKASPSNSGGTYCKLLILADDLTGTADSAVGCATAGLSTQVNLSPQPGLTADVIAIDMNSRDYPSQEAARCITECLQQWRGSYSHLYKKVDSTLRGNIAAELSALIPLAGMAIVAPAFPATGRTTLNGRQYLNDQPVEACEVWINEGLTGRADLMMMLKIEGLSTALMTLDQLHRSAEAVRDTLVHWQQAGIQAVICDALTDKDLMHLAQASASIEHVFWAGSGGLSQHLPEALGLTAGTSAPDILSVAQGPTLIVVGSMNSTSHAQADALLAGDSEIVSIDIEVDQLREPVSLPSLRALRERIQRVLADGRDLLVRLIRSGEFNDTEGPQLSQQLGQLLAPALPLVVRLVATGGATARAILISADITHLRLLDSPHTGMARLCTLHNGHRLEVVTKAGGFGNRDALLRVWQSERSKFRSTDYPRTSS
ncbi:four-carbon acid sugar kinase family protein [Halomonas sp. QX-2]|uniref:Four-carbon acid sugar kinase family protein n=1 Tax=Vreelandella sedimenti TaxID=2729618 RepID=A0A7Z0NB51_9GAMM|nr:four-carbon acid sugar kinase family protein [Halomonas sedimenti]NYT74999.1 four-carbon acid sugar kinase family protein [Halomonas sedimenti]